MSLRILVDDHIGKLFIDNPELKTVNKNQFEIAVASFANLKYLNGLELDDLMDGILGEGGDEGIDLCYVFCNGAPVNDDEYPLNKESHVKVKFFQVKKENGFSVDGFRKTKEGIDEIFNLELDLEQLKNLGANPDFIRKADLIRKIFRRCGLAKAKFSCEVFYVTIAPELKIPEKIFQLEKELKEHPLNIPFEVSYLGAQQLLNLTESVDELIEVNFVSQPLEIKERDVETSGFCGFVAGDDLVRSLLDEQGKFKSYLTDGNVRFFLGEDTAINSSIIETAKSKIKSDIFWAMNNGLTIIGEAVKPVGSNQYAITNPQIVNGCQTIHCLHTAFEEHGGLPKTLKVFVKIVNTDDLEVQTDIISATNSQNPVKAASLKANDNIQRNIEKHLEKVGIFYERRENYYKRQGYTGNKVVSLLKMAQVVNTVANKEAIISLNDPSSFFDSAGKYSTLFNDLADYDFYRFAVQLYQKAWSLKNSDLRTNNYSDEAKAVVSRGGLLFLHAMSSIIMSEATFADGSRKPLIDNIVLSLPARNNEFTKRKESIFKILEDDAAMKACYERARKMMVDAIKDYVTATGKDTLSVFKYRSFDKEYLRPVIAKALGVP
ncbi:AIPR family protein [Pseudomonas sp. MWU13-3659]|uniref:AIPR family protein n=1 Tax=Pseudomonas sp. MWU13-3659 TaxID=2986964 RepID=UPI0020764AB9|nr:AIPR family protein [Pseudomonas sp. MWU13-3659]